MNTSDEKKSKVLIFIKLMKEELESFQSSLDYNRSILEKLSNSFYSTPEVSEDIRCDIGQLETCISVFNRRISTLEAISQFKKISKEALDDLLTEKIFQECEEIKNYSELEKPTINLVF